jgi:hypothetical protein
MTLLDQIAIDRFNEDEGSPEERIQRRWFNRGSKHVEGLVRMHMGLAEVREAKPIDLTFKAALTGGIK